MANLKEIRIRITSVNSTKQITSAMKMVSAAKLRRAQDAIVKMRPYAAKLTELLGNVASATDDETANIYAEKREPNKICLVPITSNRGLCGPFNSNVIKKARSLINDKYKQQNEQGNLSVISIGKKGADYFQNNGYNLTANHSEIFNDLTFDHVASVVEKIMKMFAGKEVDRVEIIYNRFKNAATQILINEPLLPVSTKKSDKTGQNVCNYIYEPNQQVILRDLVPKALKTHLFSAILDSHAAEHGARMTAMHKATDNATDLIKELKLYYNKARQAAITTEILEVVSGAEALG